ncbi:DUF4157 domain-containing protein [Kitasatospora aureofaciens]|uniref:eCIS core domain-containing protein n=1 Tax=Kitasatospora aureofaciens TaxID=1894 RepID=UPI0005277CE9|nr:DUF4157 domain-containing protein [Kitasatospora aureofaciens]
MHERTKNPSNDTTSRTAPGRRSAARPSATDQNVWADAPMTAQTARFLQTTVGNAAVARMIQQQRHAHRPPGGGRDAAAGTEAETAPVQRSVVHDVLRSPGRPLAEPVRTEMEARLGEDFRAVRVHDDALAARSAAEIGARAYTSGEHVVLGRGGSDDHTLAHELTHVIQQRRGPVAGTEVGSGLRVSSPSDRFERAAEANATEALRRPLPASVARPLPGSGPVPLGVSGTQDHSRAPIQRAPSGTAGAAPVATQAAFTHLAGDDLEGECGYFERRRALSVNPPQQGVIIQEITRVLAVEQWDGQAWAPLPNTAIDSYVTARNSTVHATVGRYWELWQVDGQGNVSDGAEDTFGLPSIIPGRKRVNTTRGTYTITGNAVFYPTAADPAALGFTRGGAAPAGGLYSTLSDPSGAIAANGLTATGQPVRCRVHVQWDSSASDRYSVVTMT